MNLNLSITQFFIGLCLSISVILLPVKGFLAIMLLAVIIDTATGIAASVKRFGWSSLVSTKYFNVPIKLFFYWAVIYMFYIIDKHVFNARFLDVDLLLTKAVTVVFLYIESKSFDENQQAFSGKSIATWIRDLYRNLKKIKRDFSDLSE